MKNSAKKLGKNFSERFAGTKKRIRRVLCFFGLHRWEKHQELMCTMSGCDMRSEVVIAWDQCRVCAKSKLVHILK